MLRLQARVLQPRRTEANDVLAVGWLSCPSKRVSQLHKLGRKEGTYVER